VMNSRRRMPDKGPLPVGLPHHEPTDPIARSLGRPELF